MSDFQQQIGNVANIIQNSKKAKSLFKVFVNKWAYCYYHI